MADFELGEGYGQTVSHKIRKYSVSDSRIGLHPRSSALIGFHRRLLRILSVFSVPSVVRFRIRESVKSAQSLDDLSQNRLRLAVSLTLAVSFDSQDP